MAFSMTINTPATNHIMIYENDTQAANETSIGSGGTTESGRTIRSYSLRQGRITASQRAALETLWPIYGLSSHQTLEASAIFKRDAPIIVEIGFGNGESLVQMAAAQPAADFLGIEVHRPGVGHLLLRLKELGLSNVRIYCSDAVEILTRNVADKSLAGINLFFPDPWPKKRHHKRRLVNPEFVEIVARKLKPGGSFHAATDWREYAQQMLSILEACPELRNTAVDDVHYPLRPLHRPLTKFEARGQRLGHEVWDLIFTRR